MFKINNFKIAYLLASLISNTATATPNKETQLPPWSKNITLDLNVDDVEFETFLVRYSTHYPLANFEKTFVIAKQSFLKFCKDNHINKEECLLSPNNNSIEKLLESSYRLRTTIRQGHKLDASNVDRELLINGINLMGDKYSRMSQPTIEKPPTTLNLGKPRDTGVMTINHFDSKKGCIDTYTLKNINVFNTFDLSENGGGDLSCTLEALSHFLPAGEHNVATIFTQKGEIKLWVTGLANKDFALDKKLIVSKNTASSAEIFTKSLMKNGWEVRGLPMMGKRSIQARFKSAHGDYFITIGKFTI